MQMSVSHDMVGSMLCLVLLAPVGLSQAAAQTIDGGTYHTVAVLPNGTVWTWGDNADGQLGDGTTTDRHVPTETTVTSAIAAQAGGSHTLVRTITGDVLAWGQNSHGQLGDGTTTNRLSPVALTSLVDVVAVAAGGAFSLALDHDGSVWAWGANSNGQLGLGHTTQMSSPTAASALSDVVAIAAGNAHAVALRTDGTVWTWGSNARGELGNGSTTSSSAPAQIPGITTAVAITAGYAHTVVLLANGTLLSWGANTYGQLGDGTTTQRTSPVTINTLTDVVAITAGSYHTLARLSDGMLVAWGYNGPGTVGDGTTSGRTTPVAVAIGPVATVGAGHTTTFAVTAAGVVSTWGSNVYGQRGDGTTDLSSTPQAISDVGYQWLVGWPMLSLASGTYYTDKVVTVVTATPDATIHYTLDGSEPSQSSPAVASGSVLDIDQSLTLRVQAFHDTFAPSRKRAATYTMHVNTVTRSPGAGTYTTPQLLTLSTTTPEAAVHYTTDGSSVTLGSPTYTTPLGIATTTTLKVRAYRDGWTPSSETTVTYAMNFGALDAPVLSAGTGTYVSGLTVTVSAVPGVIVRYTTNGANPTSSSPVYADPIDVSTSLTLKVQAVHPDYTSSPVVSATYTIAVAAPEVTHTSGTYPAGTVIDATSATAGAALRYTFNGGEPTESDMVWPEGGLVVGDFTIRIKAFKSGCTASPSVMLQYGTSGAFTAYRLEAGSGRSFAIRADGTLWAWGQNSSGSLGDGTTTTRLLPVSVSGLTGVTAVANGSLHTLALRQGVVWSWGSGSSGALGAGSTTSRSRPAGISTFATAVAIAAGNTHSVALAADGTVWTWGANTYGQLGLGDTTNRNVPTQIAGLTNVTAIAAGDTHTLAARSDGTVWTWGRNNYGQLGDGTTTNRSTPVQASVVSGIVQVTGGTSHSLAVGSGGQLWVWGQGGNRLGLSGSSNVLSPMTHPSITTAVRAVASTDASHVQLADGSIVAFGSNTSGKLGIGNATSTSTPTALAGTLPPATHSAFGSSHGLFTTADGVVYAWGANGTGQLGDGTTTGWYPPTAISEPGMVWRLLEPTLGTSSGLYETELAVKVTGLPAGTLHYTLDGTLPTGASPTVASGATVAVTQSATLSVIQVVSGAPASQPVSATYELQVPRPTITPVTGTYGTVPGVTLTAASSATIRYTLDGLDPTETSTLYVSPLDVSETATVKARAYRTGWTPSVPAAASYWVAGPTLGTPTLSPVTGTYAVPLLVTATSVDTDAVLRYTLDGTAPHGTSAIYREPLLITSSSTISVRAFKTGASPSATASAVYTTDAIGQTPTPVISPFGGRYTTQQVVTVTGSAGATLRYTLDGSEPSEVSPSIASGGTLTIDRTRTLKVRAWSTGLDSSAMRRAAFVITGDLAAGASHSLALTATGDVYGWGYNNSGQAGPPSGTKLSPSLVLTDAQAVEAGENFSVALKADGTVVAWGVNNHGQLGDGTRTNRSTPVPVTGLTQVSVIAAGDEHVLVIRADGTVWAWGSNVAGQLGDGTTTDRLTPVLVPGLAGVQVVRAGGDTSLALTTDGADTGVAWTWGRNAKRQLGDGTTRDSAVPIRVPGLSGLAVATLGATWATVLDREGRAWTWGDNYYGQLGNGTTVSEGVPVGLATGEPLQTLDGGFWHMLATDGGGRVWGWGQHGDGKLGPSTTVCPNQGCRVPVRVPDLTDAIAVRAGRSHTLVLRADGRVVGLGSNGWGQLGDGTGTSSAAPVVIPSFSLVVNDELLDDLDGDGLPSWREYALGSDPFDADTNANGILDGDELIGAALTHPDTDGDGVPNAIELLLGTDPFMVDTDGDGTVDGLDAFPLDPTRATPLTPAPGDTTPPTVTITSPDSVRPQTPDDA